MAATGYTPIYLYYSSTATNQPSAGNLGYGELAINITDGYLYYKDNANAIQKIGYKLVPTTSGGTGLTSFTDGGVLYASGTTTLSTSSAFIYNATGLGVGVSPSFKLDIGGINGTNMALRSTGTADATFRGYVNGAEAGTMRFLNGGGIYWEAAGTEAMRIFASRGVSIGNTTDPGATNLSVTGSVTGANLLAPSGHTASAAGWFGTASALGFPTSLDAYSGGGGSAGTFMFKNTAGGNQWTGWMWNNVAGATTDALFVSFGTDSSYTGRGSISFNHTTGLTVFSTTSDERLKTNIVDSPSAYEKLDSIKIRSFDWKETGNNTEFGVIAQELHEVAPEAVVEGAEDIKNRPWSVDTSILVPMLIKAVQQLKSEFEQYVATHP